MGATRATGAQFDDVVSLGGGKTVMTTFVDSAFGAGYEHLSGFFDTSTGTLTPIDQGPREPPSGALVATGDGRLLSFGGNSDRPSRAVTLIDPATGSSRDVGPMLSLRTDATAVALSDDRILVIGGARVSPDRSDPLPTGAELFDPSHIP